LPALKVARFDGVHPPSHTPFQGEAKRKHDQKIIKTGHVGETARYDWHGGDEMVLAELNDPEYTSKERVMLLLQHLQDIFQESCSDDE